MRWPSALLDPLLFPPGLIWEGLIRTRNRLYARGIFLTRSLPAPVISIGNLTVGGSGKTPLAIYTLKALLDLGVCAALLSRGYGRANARECHVLPPGAATQAVALTVGDEPALIRLRVPGIWLGISGDRFQAARHILKQEPGAVFLMDDGFQHLQLRRNLNIAILDSSQPFAANRLLPRGTLREPIDGLRRADAVIVHGRPSAPASAEVEEAVRGIHPDCRVLHCRQLIDAILPFDTWKSSGSAEHANPSRAFLAAAIGNPRRFQRDVEELGIQVRGARFYRDHRRLTAKDWASCAAESQRVGADVVLTTEKDAVKIDFTPPGKLMIAIQSTQMAEEAEFRQLLKGCIEGAR